MNLPYPCLACFGAILGLGACASSGSLESAAEIAAAPRAFVPSWTPTPPPPRAALPALKPQKQTRFTLKNGLEVIVVEHHRKPIVSVRLLLPTGTLSDRQAMPGATVFAVELLGDYYEKRNDNPIPFERSFDLQVTEAGGSYSADVSFEHTLLAIDGYAQDVGLYLRMLTKAITQPRCGERMFDARRRFRRVLIKDVDPSSDTVFFSALAQSLFGATHVYAQSPFGTLESLKKLYYNAVFKHQKALLVPAGAKVVVVGDVNPREVHRVLQKTLGTWSGGKALKATRSVKPPKVRRRKHVLYVPRKGAKTTIMCAGRALSDIEASDEALEMLTMVLGQGVGSRLTVNLRRRFGLSYHAEATLLQYGETRALTACTRIDKEHTTDALRLFIESLDGLRINPPSTEELKSAQTRLASMLLSQHDSVPSSTEAVLDELRRPGRGSPASRLKRLEETSIEALGAIAQKAFKQSELHFILSGQASVIRESSKLLNLGPLKKVSIEGNGK